MSMTPEQRRDGRRMVLIAIVIFALDQLTKLLVLELLGPGQEQVIIDGFFKFVCWGNTGAAWSLANNNNFLLAGISFAALLGLFFWRNRFDTRTIPRQIAFSLLFGGIGGNLFDRVHPHRFHVIDFLRFYMYRRSGEEIGFPAFNVADSAICIGVGLMILLSYKQETENGK